MCGLVLARSCETRFQRVKFGRRQILGGPSGSLLPTLVRSSSSVRTNRLYCGLKIRRKDKTTFSEPRNVFNKVAPTPSKEVRPSDTHRPHEAFQFNTTFMCQGNTIVIVLIENIEPQRPLHPTCSLHAVHQGMRFFLAFLKPSTHMSIRRRSPRGEGG